MEKKLYRDEQHKVIGGVCAGLADYLGIDISIIRALFLLSLLLKGGGLIIYIVLWIVLPKRPYAYFNPGVDYRVPPQQSGNPFENVPPQPGAPFNNPFVNPQKKPASVFGLIFGGILIFTGAAFLLNEFNIFPNWDLVRLWPIVLVGAGAALIFSGKKKQPWETEGWNNTGAPFNNAKEEIKDTPPTV